MYVLDIKYYLQENKFSRREVKTSEWVEETQTWVVEIMIDCYRKLYFGADGRQKKHTGEYTSHPIYFLYRQL